MKKQILILALFVLAALANVTKSYGQCAEDALHPIAGKPYDYKVTLTGGGTAKTISWFVTKNTGIVVSSGTYDTGIAPTATTYTVNGPANAATINITWAPALIADALVPNNYYLVVKYVTTNSEGCEIDNVNAFKIKPVNMFQLDLANIISTGAAKTGENVCTSTVVSASITDNGTTATITYDYGATDIFAKVTVKNFAGSWNMTTNRDALVAAAAGAGESAKLYWGLESVGPTGAAVEITDNNPVTITEQNAADATTPEIIYLRLHVTHGIFDGTTAETFNFIVNATDLAGNPDVDATTCANTLTDDQVTQTILDRPDIANNGTLGGTLINP